MEDPKHLTFLEIEISADDLTGLETAMKHRGLVISDLTGIAGIAGPKEPLETISLMLLRKLSGCLMKHADRWAEMAHEIRTCLDDKRWGSHSLCQYADEENEKTLLQTKMWPEDIANIEDALARQGFTGTDLKSMIPYKSEPNKFVEDADDAMLEALTCFLETRSETWTKISDEIRAYLDDAYKNNQVGLNASNKKTHNRKNIKRRH